MTLKEVNLPSVDFSSGVTAGRLVCVSSACLHTCMGQVSHTLPKHTAVI